MKITALSSLLVSSLVSLAVAAPARADHKAAAQPATRVAAVAQGAELSTGEQRLTGARGSRSDAIRGAVQAADTIQAAIAGSTRAPMAAFLEPTEVAAEVRPYAPEIERCYLDRLGDVRRAGRLDLTFVIGRDGMVASVNAAAPGLPASTVHRMTRCIREAVDALHFPARSSDTTAIVPYYFQHTNAPDGGPQLSCWNPKGCH